MQHRRVIGIQYAELDGLNGVWDPETETIWIHRGMSIYEIRMTLFHELAHALRGDEGCDHHVEGCIRRTTARVMIPIERLAEVLRWTTDDYQVAEELHVDLDTLEAMRECLRDDFERLRAFAAA